MNTSDGDERAGASGGLGTRLLENLSTAVVLLGDDLRVCYANPAAEQLLATSIAHMQGQPMAVFFAPGDWSDAELYQALDEQRPLIRREARLQRAGQSDAPMVDYGATPLIAAGACQLLLELRPLERQLRLRREDNLLASHQATRALVHGLAHEIRNPLGGIRGAAQLLARALADAQLREYTSVIISETDRLDALVERMLGPRQPPQRRWINIHQALERVRVIVQAQAGDALTLCQDYDPSLPELWADLDQLIQVLLNLVRNAAQALLETPRGNAGRARIVLRTRALRQYTIGGVRHRLVCQVQVEDNGPGIDAAMLPTLFYPMVSGREQGSGLGLPIAQSIVQQHGGLIECDSRPGHTIFTVCLPFGSANGS